MADGNGGAAMSGGASRGMGRGLAAILRPVDDAGTEALRELSVELIRPNPRQPRQTFEPEALVALSESIRARGMLQPLVVRPLAGGHYELIAGERRLRAAQMAELDRVPALIRDAEDTERLELALIENMAREDLNPVDEARACATLVEDLGLTQEELARRVGKSRVAVSNLIRLLTLPDEALALIEAGGLAEGHGRALLLCKDQTERRRLARRAHQGAWSVRETERHARAAQQELGRRPQRPEATVHPDLADVLGAAEDILTTALGREVRVRARRSGCRVEIDLEDAREAIDLGERLMRRRSA